MVKADIRVYSRIVAHQVRNDTLSWLSFSTLLAWMFGLYWSNLATTQTAFELLGNLQTRALWLISEALTLLVLLFAFSAARKREKLCIVFAGSCLLIGTSITLLVPEASTTLYSCMSGIAMTGIGSGTLLACIGIRFSEKGSKVLLIDVALALATASLIDIFLLLMPGSIQPITISLLPILCTYLMLIPTSTKKTQATALEYAPQKDENKFSSIRIIALPIVVGFAYGLMQQLAGGASNTGAATAEADIITVLSFFLSAIVISLTALFIDSRKLIKTVCFVAIPLIGAAFVMLPIFSDAQEAAQAISTIGFNSFYFMIWALWTGNQENPARPRRFILGLLMLVGSEALGSYFGAALLPIVMESGSTLAIVSLVVVYLLLMAGIFSFDHSTNARRSASLFNNTPAPPPLQSQVASTETWAHHFGLSARETEVFDMLAKGRNRTYISKTLFISDNTTRTHMKNVYRKLGVHSQQELIDLLEENQLTHNAR